MNVTEYRKLTIVVWLNVLVAMAALWGKDAWQGTRWDTDDFMRLVQVRDFISGQGWADLTQYRLNPPDGTPMHWSRLADVPLAAATLAFSTFLSMNNALVVAAMIVPPLYFLLFVLCYAPPARLMLGAARSPTGLVTLICGSAMIPQFAPGRVDHHGLQLIMIMASIGLLLIGLGRARWHKLIALAGIPFALSVWIGIEMLPLIAAWFAALGLVWCRNGDDLARRGALAATVGALIGVGLLLTSVRAERWLMPACDAFSIVPVGALALIALGFALMDFVGRRIGSIKGRFLLAGACGAVVAALFVLIFPGCTSGGLGNLDPDVKRFWLDNVVEAAPLIPQFRASPFAAMGELWPSLLGLAYALWRCVRGGARARALWGVMAFLVTFSAALMLLQVRTSTSANVVALIPLSGLIAELWERIRGRRPRWQQFALLLPVVLLGSAVFWPAVSAAHKYISGRMTVQTDGNGAVGEEETCMSRAPIPVLAAQPPARILNYIDFGPMLLFTTPHAVLGAPYHRNNGGLKDTILLFRSEDDELIRARLKERGIDWIVTCPGTEDRVVYHTDRGKGLAERLAAGQVPAYLTEVADPARPGLKLYRVTP